MLNTDINTKKIVDEVSQTIKHMYLLPEMLAYIKNNHRKSDEKLTDEINELFLSDLTPEVIRRMVFKSFNNDKKKRGRR